MFNLSSGTKHMIWIISEQILRSGGTLLTSVLLARSASPQEYGIYTYLYPFSVILLCMQNGLSSTPYVTRLPDFNEVEKKGFLGNVFLLHIGISFLMFLGIMILGFCVKNQPSVNLMTYNTVLLFGFTVITWLLRDFIRQILLATIDTKSVFFFGLSVHSVMIAGLIILYLTNQMTLNTTYSCLIISSTLPSFVYLFKNWRTLIPSVARCKQDFVEAWRIGKWLVARQFIILISGAPLLTSKLVAMGHVNDVSLYGACIMPATLLSPITSSLLTFLVPKLAQVRTFSIKHIKKIVSKISMLLLVLLITFNISIYFLSDIIMQIVFANKYQASPWLITLFTLQMSVLIYSIPVEAALIALKKTRNGFIADSLSAVFTICFGLSLVHFFGIWGMAISLLCSKMIGRGYQILIFKTVSANRDQI